MFPKLLITWIGHTDLLSYAAQVPDSERKAILQSLKKDQVGSGLGPIKTLTDHVEFERIVLLSNYDPELSAKFAAWVGPKAEVVDVEFSKPTDYESIYRGVSHQLNKLRSEGALEGRELCMHLSPGTPAMAAIWVLLGKSKFPATFYQTHDGQAWVTEVPFNLTVDFLPELYARPDRQLVGYADLSLGEVTGFEQIIGESHEIRAAVGRARRAAGRWVPILLLGESGVGKELFAQAIHKASPRCEQKFIAINCAAVSPDLLESELFGHAAGAYTGAKQKRDGVFKQADGGTLFLDEVGECSLEMQAKLLRVLQPPAGKSPCHREFRPVGANEDESSNVRVIAATNRDLISEVKAGKFREDLYYRLAVFTVTIPPLRERKADVPALAEDMLKHINHDLAAEGEPGYVPKQLSAEAMRFLRQYNWPGNVRQLKNALVQAAVLTEGAILEQHHLRDSLGEMPRVHDNVAKLLDHPLGDDFDLDDYLDRIQDHLIQRAMLEANSNVTAAAKLLGLSQQTLSNRISKKKSRTKKE